MSFILDALKKSEAERQRQTGPTLLEVRITRPRRRYPVWAAIVGVLLGVNAVALVAFVLRRPASPSVERPAGEAATAAVSGARGPVSLPQSQSGGPAAAATGASAIPAAAVAVPPSPADLATRAATGAGLAQPGAVVPLASAHNPADDAPALPAGSAQLQRPGPESYANLPSISELGASVPALQLDLLDYSDQPSERYALINMHRVREGDVLPEGPRVLAITRDGVALDYGGKDFLLRPGGGAQ